MLISKFQAFGAFETAAIPERCSLYHLASVSNHKLASEYSGDVTQSLRREILVRNLLLNLYQQPPLDQFEELLRGNPDFLVDYFIEEEFEEAETEGFGNVAKRIKYAHTEHESNISSRHKDLFIYQEVNPPSTKFTFLFDSQNSTEHWKSPSSRCPTAYSSSKNSTAYSSSKCSAAYSDETFGLKKTMHLMLSLSLD
ncbi:hypothetical protein K7432_000837 [Basidiobolus ranarum]|uniref:Uncharacterized protein n=1 Tax=Basidiobolus ranarum TaxID=34480 RepID=A0ABR2X436_9FUNG